MTESMTGARLVAGTGELAGLSHVIAGEATIGRSAENDVVVNLPILSGRHARVYVEDDIFYLEDLGSRNGTRLDGVRITTRARLGNLHVVTLADAVDLVFVRAREEPAPAPKAAAPSPATPVTAVPETVSYDTQIITAFTDVIEIPGPSVSPAEAAPASPSVDAGSRRTPEPTADAGARPSSAPTQDAERPEETRYDLDFGALVDPRNAPEPPRPTTPIAQFDLVLVLPDGRQQVYQLKSGDNVLGRSSECDVVLPDPDQWLSRKHAVLSVEPDAIHLADNGTVNGTFVRDSRIPSTPIPIDVGTTFRLGPHLVLTLVRR